MPRRLSGDARELGGAAHGNLAGMGKRDIQFGQQPALDGVQRKRGSGWYIDDIHVEHAFG